MERGEILNHTGDSPDLLCGASAGPSREDRVERALNKLRYMKSATSALAPTAWDIDRLIEILEGKR